MSQTKFSPRTVHATAPSRFDFAGGPTDVDPFKQIEGGFVVNAGITHKACVTITERSDSMIRIRSDDFMMEECFDSISTMDLKGVLRLIKAAVKYINPKVGMDIHTKVNISPGSGLGSSAALCVALLGALRMVRDSSLADQECLVADALYVENVMLQNINGGQDQYASALGGFHSFRFERDNVSVDTLPITQKTIEGLEERSILCYSGDSHLSGQVLTQIMDNYIRGDVTTVQSLHAMKKIAQEIEGALIEGNLHEFGKLINLAGQKQRSYHPSITPQNVAQLLSLAEKHGAIGGKMAGAGGGGCLYFYSEVDRKPLIVKALSEAGVVILPLHFSEEGVMVQVL